jgi:hypothetical protein
LTHFLWPALVESQARVVGISISSTFFPLERGGSRAVLLRPGSPGSSMHDIDTLDGLFSYGRRKRANLLHTWELHRRYIMPIQGFRRWLVIQEHIHVLIPIFGPTAGPRCFPASLALKNLQTNWILSMRSHKRVP